METLTEQSLQELLSEIQQKLKVPKSQFNKFANFNYRSLEDIQEAIKPLLNGAVLTLEDEIVMIGDRYYVKATAKITLNDENIITTAYAREAETKKGMDDSQITGSASSYARKYALNGLFAIDDSRDADTQDNTKEIKKEVKKQEKPEKKVEPKKPDQVLYSQLWAKITASKSMEDLTVQAKKLKENEHKLSEEMVEKLKRTGAKKKKEILETAEDFDNSELVESILLYDKNYEPER